MSDEGVMKWTGPVWSGDFRLKEQWLSQPIRWHRPRRILVCAYGDLFHENVPDEWVDKIFGVMALAPRHEYQVLTRRPGRMHQYLSDPNIRKRVGAAGYNIAADCLCQVIYDPSIWEPLHTDDIYYSFEPEPYWPLKNVLLGVIVEYPARVGRPIAIVERDETP